MQHLKLDPFSPKQMIFMIQAQAKWNLAHGSVRSGKTVCTVAAFLHCVEDCIDNKIYIVGHTFDTAYRNIVRLIMESNELAIFRPFCAWTGKKLYFKDKCITILGAKDEGAIKNFQGDTHSLTYCDEMSLYPESIIDMIDTRLSPAHSKGFAAMNPSHPSHKLKGWIDKAEAGDPNYYSLHFTLDDNPYVDEAYKNRIKNSLSGVFYKRNYLGLWCMAEGAIFDFFDRDVHVCNRAPASAEYYVAGIDYGSVNPFACVLVGVNTGRYTQAGSRWWVEKEYYYDPKVYGKQRVNSEFAMDVHNFLEPYGVKYIYCDPSAASFKLELRRLGIQVIDADNDVYNGIQKLSSEMAIGNLSIMDCCPNLIREVESYVWDNKKAIRGEDEPLKKGDHAIDALRYVVQTHKIVKPTNSPIHDPNDYMAMRFQQTTRSF